MKEKDLLTVLRQSKVFGGFEINELHTLLTLGKERAYARGAIVIGNDPKNVKYFFLVLRGAFEVVLRDFRRVRFDPGAVFGEIGVISRDMRFGTVQALQSGRLLVFPASILHPEGHSQIESRLQYKLLYALTRQIINYMDRELQHSALHLSTLPESETLEFKRSFNSKDSRQKRTLARTVAAFLNTRGGTLLYGVHEKLGLCGIPPLLAKDKDRLQNDLNAYLMQHLGKEVNVYTNLYLESCGEREILRIDCLPSKTPVFCCVSTSSNRKDSEQFYIRKGAACYQLTPSEMATYLHKRFFTATDSTMHAVS